MTETLHPENELTQHPEQKGDSMEDSEQEPLSPEAITSRIEAAATSLVTAEREIADLETKLTEASADTTSAAALKQEVGELTVEGKSLEQATVLLK